MSESWADKEVYTDHTNLEESIFDRPADMGVVLRRDVIIIVPFQFRLHLL